MRFNFLFLFGGLALAFSPVAFGQENRNRVAQFEYICQAFQDAVPAAGKFRYDFRFDAKVFLKPPRRAR